MVRSSVKKSSDEMKGGQSKSGMTIKGEVLRVEGDTYFETLLTSPVRPAQRNASKNLVQRETPGLRPVLSMSVKETS